MAKVKLPDPGVPVLCSVTNRVIWSQHAVYDEAGRPYDPQVAPPGCRTLDGDVVEADAAHTTVQQHEDEVERKREAGSLGGSVDVPAGGKPKVASD